MWPAAAQRPAPRLPGGGVVTLGAELYACYGMCLGWRCQASTARKSGSVVPQHVPAVTPGGVVNMVLFKVFRALA